MISQIAFFPIFGKPLIMWGGLTALLLLLFAALIPVLQKKWPKFFSFKLHVLMARIAVLVAFLHGLLGILLFL